MCNWFGMATEKLLKGFRTYVWKIPLTVLKIGLNSFKKPMKMTILMAICFTWNIEKTHKKRMIVSRETLYIYAYLRIIIRLKAWNFAVYKNQYCIQNIPLYTCMHMIVYKYSCIRVFVYTCILVSTQYVWVLIVSTRWRWMLTNKSFPHSFPHVDKVINNMWITHKICG